jgi:hypothetical protein
MTKRRTAFNDGTIVSVTNDHERELRSWRGLPESVRSDFDYIKPDEGDDWRFVEYRGSWYDVNDTEGLAPDSLKAQGWDVYASDSFSSGVVFRHFDREGNYLEGFVVVGRYWVED